MIKQLCRDCIKAHLEREHAFVSLNGTHQECMDIHEMAFEGWFERLWCYTRSGAAPCFRSVPQQHAMKYMPFHRTYSYDWITSPPNSCPCILEHLVCDANT